MMETTLTFLMCGVLLSRSVMVNWPWFASRVLRPPSWIRGKPSFSGEDFDLRSLAERSVKLGEHSS
jgi:hypothetical protein